MHFFLNGQALYAEPAFTEAMCGGGGCWDEGMYPAVSFSQYQVYFCALVLFVLLFVFGVVYVMWYNVLLLLLLSLPPLPRGVCLSVRTARERLLTG